MERVYSGAFLVLIGLGAAYLAIGYGLGDSQEPGSGYFPFILGLTLTGLGVVIAIREFRSSPAESSNGKWPLCQLTCIISALLAFALLIGGVSSTGFRGAGLVPAMFVLVFITGLAGRKLTLRENLLLSVVLTMLSMAIFVALFGIAIPLWPWSY